MLLGNPVKAKLQTDRHITDMLYIDIALELTPDCQPETSKHFGYVGIPTY